MKSARHEGIVPRRIAENDELRAADGRLIARQFRRTLDDLAHLAHAVHVDARLRRAEVDRGTDELRRRKRLRNGRNQHLVAMRITLFNECRKAADEIDADLLRRAVERLGYGYEGIRLAGIRRDGDRRDGNALVDDGDAVLRLDVSARLHEELCRLRDLVVDVATELLNVRMRAVTKRYTHRDRAHVELVLRDHAVCF